MGKKEKALIGKSCRLLRTVYGLEAKKVAKDIGISQSHFLRVESGYSQMSLNVCNGIKRYFGLDFNNLIEIGKLETPIETFLYLQEIGRI